MEAPNKIYATVQGSQLLGCSTKPYRYCEEYIRKDALLEWANDVKQGLIVELEKYRVPNEQRIFAFQEFIDKLNSL